MIGNHTYNFYNICFLFCVFLKNKYFSKYLHNSMQILWKHKQTLQDIFTNANIKDHI